MTFQEARIVHQLMQQVELGTQEVEPYLDIYTSLEQVVENMQASDKAVTLKLSETGPQNLLLFMQRVTIPGIGAEQINEIIKKVQKELPKEAKAAAKTKAAPKKVTLQLTGSEIQLVQKMLDQIDLSIAEVEPFLAIYTPIAQANDPDKDLDSEFTLKLPATGPQNLLLFMQRATLSGSQAKRVYTITDKIQHLVTLSDYVSTP